MQNQHNDQSRYYPQNSVTIVAVTWNLYGCLPPVNSLVQLSRSLSFDPLPDIILFGTQQCQRSLWASFCCQGKEGWQTMLSQVFSGYVVLASEVMRGLHLAVLVAKKIKDYFSLDTKQKMRAGTCGIMGNKGAISIQFTIFNEKVQVINCHLAPHQNGNDLRNATIQRIMMELVRKDLKSSVIFLGDFNYRIEMNKKDYQLMIRGKNNTEQQMNYTSYINKEQLINQRQLRQNFLLRFQEGKIQFPPTYKIGVNNNQYNRQRIPGWTDRIFARKDTQLQRKSYISEYNITGCDHRPVLARYEKEISFEGQSFSSDFKKKYQPQSSCQLI